ncbi:Macrolide export ATP-binding/permease protein MacB [Pirellulimonas nuda]|uniref:Macrolide export ATP-binding/permease protein MacB n=1 Tax=Pirellulimonas nuda TaxID=2528009 RepID=A0A518DHA0_9BACT|nr:ABC transporter permease [Pirellulimonas nuda]QDU90858.1 Macrolide export ATP-binding/permease protein MacB [Pirellulimonas nuda]
MNFISFLFRNVMRRKWRSFLTASAVAIAVASVVALVGISTGFLDTFKSFYQELGIDMLVTREGGARKLTSAIPEEISDKIAALPGVKDVIPGSVDIISLNDYGLQVVPVNGLVPGTFVFDHYRMTSGRKLTVDDGAAAMLGAGLAKAVEKNVGDTLELIPGEPYEIVGIYEADSQLDNAAVVLSLKQHQYMMDREGQVTGISIVLDDPNDKEAMARIKSEVEKMERGIVAKPTKEHVENLQEIRLAIGMAWLTSAIAMVVGTLGMLNTMIMSLQERTGEIGLLRAVGWTRSRVGKMILGESVLLSVFGGLLGVGVAFLIVWLLTLLPQAMMVNSRIDSAVVGQGMAVAVIVGVLGGVIPAMHATKLAPADALRQSH